MIDLYYAPTANGLRATIALEEAGLAYRRHKIDLAKGEQRTPAFIKLNPLCAAPVIVDDEGPGGKPLTLSQSGAIVLYAAEKTGKLMPKDAARRALAMQWFMLAASDVSGTSATMFLLNTAAPEKNAAISGFFQSRLMTFLAACNAHLESRDYLADELSVADLMLYPNTASRRALIEQAGNMPHLLRWMDALAARPAVARGMQP